jgi:tryptophan synthase alpha chain
MNRINRLFHSKHTNILSVYFTAGYPSVDSATSIIKALADAGTNMIEIGIPFSDPMADGPIIQNSSTRALKNGMSLKLLFNQLKNIRRVVDIPLLLMGYLNPAMQYGIERFCQDCATTGIDGVILPDLPLEVYQEEYKSIFEKHDLHNVFLISPQTSADRIKKIDSVSRSFIYMVSSSSITGIRGSFAPEQTAYFERIRAMKLANPALIGFGISNHDSFAIACKYAQGAIIGSAFVKILGEKGFSEATVSEFVKGFIPCS